MGGESEYYHEVIGGNFGWLRAGHSADYEVSTTLRIGHKEEVLSLAIPKKVDAGLGARDPVGRTTNRVAGAAIIYINSYSNGVARPVAGGSKEQGMERDLYPIAAQQQCFEDLGYKAANTGC